MKLLEKIVSIRNELDHKVLVVFGIKFKFKTKNLVIRNQLSLMMDKLNSLVKKEIFLYRRDQWEFDYIEDFVQELDKMDLRSKLRALTNNLDEKSIETVNAILVRCNIIHKSKCELIDIFSRGEIERILELQNIFFKRIFQVDNECWGFGKFYLPINHFEMCVFKDKHEIELLNKDHFKDKNIVDAGGFIGDSAIVFSDYTSGNVYTFEPIKQNYLLMQKTIILNQKNNIIAINKGLGDKDCESEIYSQGAASGALDIKNTQNKEVCCFTTLDNFVRENNIQVGLIKTDLEGMEKQFIKGAENTIKTQKPTLLSSIYPNADDFFNIKPLIESWNLGYKFRVVKPCDGQVLLETVLIAET